MATKPVQNVKRLNLVALRMLITVSFRRLHADDVDSPAEREALKFLVSENLICRPADVSDTDKEEDDADDASAEVIPLAQNSFELDDETDEYRAELTLRGRTFVNFIQNLSLPVEVTSWKMSS